MRAWWYWISFICLTHPPAIIISSAQTLENKYLIKYPDRGSNWKWAASATHNTVPSIYHLSGHQGCFPTLLSPHTTVQKLHLVFPSYSSASSNCVPGTCSWNSQSVHKYISILASTAVTPAGGLLVLPPPAQRGYNSQKLRSVSQFRGSSQEPPWPLSSSWLAVPQVTEPHLQALTW